MLSYHCFEFSLHTGSIILILLPFIILKVKNTNAVRIFKILAMQSTSRGLLGFFKMYFQFFYPYFVIFSKIDHGVPFFSTTSTNRNMSLFTTLYYQFCWAILWWGSSRFRWLKLTWCSQRSRQSTTGRACPRSRFRQECRRSTCNCRWTPKYWNRKSINGIFVKVI